MDHCFRNRRFLFTLQLWAGLLLAAGLIALAGARPVFAEAPQPGPQSVECHFFSYLPLVGQQAGTSAAPATSAPVITEEAFAASIIDGEAGILHGVYVPGVLALRVDQQPQQNSAYVTSQPGWVTQYASPTRFGVTGLLAHNTLSGQEFFKLASDDVVTLVDGDGAVHKYQVAQFYRFQVLPSGAGYLNLDTQEVLSPSQLYLKLYTGSDHVTFQTCLEAYGSPTWGRYFVLAFPEAEEMHTP